jgi:N-acetylglucosamine kinase-like BadF-type ATPase
VAIVAGIDGGATQTRVVIVDEKGRALGAGAAGPSNYGAAPLDVVRRSLRAALQQAYNAAGVSLASLDAFFAGMAGVTTDADRHTIEDVIRACGLRDDATLEIDHDIRIALAGGLAGQEGIVLIVGTGSSCYGRRTDGQSWQAGGWGHWIDDVGSAYWLVIEALEAAVRDYDGRGPATQLTQRLRDTLALSAIPAIIRRLHFEGPDGPGHPMTKAQIAALAPMVIEAAGAGDTVACEIVDRAADELALMVTAVARKLGFGPQTFPVTATGGLITRTPLLREALATAMAEFIEGAHLTEPRLDPTCGAALLALASRGVAITENLITQLEQSSHATTTT